MPDNPLLVQVHTVGELERVLQLKLEGHCMLGINNRDLGTFEVDLQNNKTIMDSAPGQQVLLEFSHIVVFATKFA